MRRIHLLLRLEQRSDVNWICARWVQIRECLRVAAHGITLTRYDTTFCEMTFLRCCVRGLPVINGLISSGQPNGLRVLLLNILSDESDLLARITLIAKANHVRTVERLADGFNIFLQPLVREEPTRLRRRGCRARKSPRALSNVRQELRCLERIALLLEKLIVFRRILRLLGLLLHLTCGELRLSAL